MGGAVTKLCCIPCSKQNMSSLGQLHIAAALVALAAGGWNLLRTKGTATHRRAGWVYAASLLTLNVTALLIYRLTGTFGPFHVAALISLATLAAGLLPAVRRRPVDRWLERHYYFMSYSYLGLVAAAVAETATRLPVLQQLAGGPTPVFWIAVIVASVAVFVIGVPLIRRRFEPEIRPFKFRG
jgi:uncharacterized membrane protein